MTRVYRTLGDFEHSRLRTEIFFGSRQPQTRTVTHYDGERLILREFTYVPALLSAQREIIENALDEIIGHQHGDRIEITYDESTHILTVEDNGHGLPIHEIPEVGKGPAASILLGAARSGSNFDDRGQTAGMNGVGAAVTNFTAEWFEVDIWREGKHFRQIWQEGKYAGKTIHKMSEPIIEKAPARKRGTRIRFKPSAAVFPHLLMPEEFLRGRAWDIAVAHPDLTVIFNGTRLQPKSGKDAVMATYFLDQPVGQFEVRSGTFRARYYCCIGMGEHIHSCVNNIPVFDGGSHIDGFRALFAAEVGDAIGRTVRKESLTINRRDIEQNLLWFNLTEMVDPAFDSQTKNCLISDVAEFIRRGFVAADVKAFVRRNPEWIESILDSCRRRLSSKDEKEIAREQKKRSRIKSPRLYDANARDRSTCVLFIGEGQSAVGGILAARNKEHHGVYKLTGKIMNVYGENPKKVVANTVLSEIMSSIGLYIGREPENLRYGSVFIAADEDEDGKNITALVVNFFHTFWPQLFQDASHPFIYKFSTPFIIAVRAAERRYIYADSYDRFQSDLAAGIYTGWKIIRAKGLASLTEEDWHHALGSPVLTPIVADAKLPDILRMLFDDKLSDARKDWLK